MDKRNKYLAINSIITVLMQVTTMICGLILPRMILEEFGSNVNGLTTSITQFLSFISLLDGGLGGVIRAAYYKPFANHDLEGISGVLAASNKFYKQIAYIFIGYVICLAFLFPILSKSSFDYIYTFLLVIIISLSILMQYFWGYTLKLLVFSDQKGYLHNITQIITTLVNTIVAAIAIKLGANIHIVKLIAALSYVIQPLILGYYVRHNYKLNYSAKPDEGAIKQRWSALARHIAFYVHSNTDIVVLTLFSSFFTVSIYSVYNIVVMGLTNLVAGIISNTEATFGSILASNDKGKFVTEFKAVDLITKFISTVCFSTCAIMLCIFIEVYTNGINDANYYRPVFAIILSCAEWIYCLGLNYNNIIVSVGHFKETTYIGVIEAVLNIGLSIILLKKFGIEGVVFATAIAMLFKVIANIVYIEKNIIHIDYSYIYRSNISSIITFIVSVLWLRTVVSSVSGYTVFFVEAGIVFCVTAVLNFIFDFILCNKEFKEAMIKVKGRIRK